MPPLRIAAIEFLNAAPLMWGLDRDPRFSLDYTLPSACAAALAAGEADLGVIPVIELCRIPGLVGLGGLGVAARSQVRSILLISRCPAQQIRRLALDPASRTSSALVQILLRHRFHADFEIVPPEAGGDARLVIGDPALRLAVDESAQPSGAHVYDLAQVWYEWTGLPCVFALWGVRESIWEAATAWLAPRLRQALDEGLDHREDLVADWSNRLGLPPAEVRHYLAANVEYRLDSAHHAGLDRYLQLAIAQGLLPAGARLPLASMPGNVGAP